MNHAAETLEFINCVQEEDARRLAKYTKMTRRHHSKMKELLSTVRKFHRRCLRCEQSWLHASSQLMNRGCLTAIACRPDQQTALDVGRLAVEKRAARNALQAELGCDRLEAKKALAAKFGIHVDTDAVVRAATSTTVETPLVVQVTDIVRDFTPVTPVSTEQAERRARRLFRATAS